MKQTPQAEADFEQIIRIAPQDVDDWRGRGIALDKLQRYEEAIASFDKAIEIKPDFHEAWNNPPIVLENL
ncbi:MAG: tetratricopeptide repeat protein [Heteroscytonema crispum UTEX LB 1556]